MTGALDNPVLHELTRWRARLGCIVMSRTQLGITGELSSLALCVYS
jgi:hypothetical protein